MKLLCFLLMMSSCALASVKASYWRLDNDPPLYVGQRFRLSLVTEVESGEDFQPVQLQTQVPPGTPVRSTEPSTNNQTRIVYSWTSSYDQPTTIRLAAGQMQGILSRTEHFGYMTNTQRTQVNTSLKAFSFDVVPLPPPPENFSGAIGAFNLMLELSSTQFTPGEVLTAKLSLIALTGEIPTNALPALTLPEEHFRSYPAKVTQRTPTILQTEMMFVPLEMSSTNIPQVVWSYFNTDTRSYRTASTFPKRLLYREPKVEEPIPEQIVVLGSRTQLSGSLRFAPTDVAPIVGQIPEGSSVEILERYENWVRVDVAGARGWMKLPAQTPAEHTTAEAAHTPANTADEKPTP